MSHFYHWWSFDWGGPFPPGYSMLEVHRCNIINFLLEIGVLQPLPVQLFSSKDEL